MLRSISVPTLLPLLLIPAVACRGAGHERVAAGGEPALAVGAGDQVGDVPMRTRASSELTDEIVDLVREGNYAEARAELGALLVEQHLAEGRALVNAGRPEDGLVSIDRALRIDPRDAAARRAKAHGSLALAEKGIAAGKSALLIEGALTDALDYFRLGNDTESVFGAARSAHLLGRSDEALLLAREGMARLADNPSRLPWRPERVLSEAAFTAYTGARLAEDEERSRELFAETEKALSDLLGRESVDPWVWGKLAELYEWEEKYDDARGVLERGLDRTPADVGLLERLARITGKAGGRELAVAALAAHNERHPEVPVGLWHEGLERFELATEGLESEELHPEEYQRAEELFARARTLDASLSDASKAYEVMCRNGVGWCRFQDGDLAGAREAFLSMEDVFERGMEWKIEGRLLSGVFGLQFIGAAYNERQDNLAAAEVFSTLRNYQPEDPSWANNAGFFYRDAAVQLEFQGRRLCRAARGEVTDEEALAAVRELAGVEPGADTKAEREAFARASDRTMDRAHELIRRSREAYLAAAELLPEDVRVVNDTALILVYYTHDDLELAKEMLLRCVEMGARQVAAGDLDEDALWELENAWGDAHQNLGVLHAIHENDAEEAQRWLERSIEIGPDPRPLLSEFWLPYLRGEIEERRDLEELRTWGQPCDPSPNR